MPYAHPQQKKDWYANNPNQSDKRRVRQVKSRKAKRAFIVECKNVPCMDCGVTYPHYVMEFDHREPEHKQFIISEATNYITCRGTN